jgi:capsule polysaccharide export protein KpsE/RkpR
VADIYHLDEYKHAKQVVEEIPKIIKSLDTCLNVLQNYTGYIDVVSIIWGINENRICLEAKYEYYKKRLEDGAKLNE